MINYDDWDSAARQRRPRQRRSRRYITVVTAVLAVAALIAAGRVLLPASSSHAVASGKGPGPATLPAGALSLGACIDPTASIVSSFAPSIRKDLARAVGSLAPPTTPLATAATPSPLPGVSLTVRQVDTNSLSSDPGPYARRVTVPGVPGLAYPQPGLSVPDYNSRLRAWSGGYQAVGSARRAAAAAATRAARDIAALPLHTNAGHSGIAACISGLLLTIPQRGQHAYLLASDLQDNVPPQLAGSFHGAPLVIVQTCDSGDAALCQGLLRAFQLKMRRLDVGRITVIRPENAAQAIRQWVHTGTVTP